MRLLYQCLHKKLTVEYHKVDLLELLCLKYIMSSLYESLPPEGEFALLQHAEKVVNEAAKPVFEELGELAAITEATDEKMAGELAALSANELTKEAQAFVNAKHDLDEADATRLRSIENREWLRAQLQERGTKNLKSIL